MKDRESTIGLSQQAKRNTVNEHAGRLPSTDGKGDASLTTRPNPEARPTTAVSTGVSRVDDVAKEKYILRLKDNLVASLERVRKNWKRDRITLAF